jgi:hypothetical protein
MFYLALRYEEFSFRLLVVLDFLFVFSLWWKLLRSLRFICDRYGKETVVCWLEWTAMQPPFESPSSLLGLVEEEPGCKW